MAAVKTPKITSSIFSGGGVEEIAAADVYKDTITAESTLSGFKSTVSESVSKLGNMFKTTRFDATDLVKTINLKDGVGLDKSALTSQLSKVSGYRFDSTSTFLSGLQGTATDKLTSYLGKDQSSIKNLLGEVVSVANGDGTSARSLFGVIGDVLGGDWVNYFPDIAGQAAFFGTLIEKAMELGIPDAIDDLLDKIDDEETRKELLISNAEKCAKAGDIANLELIKGYIGAAALKAKVPDLVKYVMQGYKLPTNNSSNATVPDYAGIYSKMMSLFNSVDPGWDVTDRNGVKISRLYCFVTASESTRKVFAYAGSYADVMLLAPSYPTNTAKAIATRDFPGIVTVA